MKPKISVTMIAIKPKKDMNDQSSSDASPNAPSESDVADALPDSSDNQYDDSTPNRVELGDSTFPQGKDGDEVEFTGKGMLAQKPDGSFCVDVNSIEGVPVSVPDQSDNSDNSDTTGNSQERDNGVESAKKALMGSIQNQGGYNNSQA